MVFARRDLLGGLYYDIRFFSWSLDGRIGYTLESGDSRMVFGAGGMDSFSQERLQSSNHIFIQDAKYY